MMRPGCEWVGWSLFSPSAYAGSATCFTRASRALATPGGPSSSTERQLIDLWLAQPRLELEETRMLMRMLFDEHPVPNDWLQRRPHQPAPSCGAQLDGIVCSASHRRPASRSRWSKTAPCRR